MLTTVAIKNNNKIGFWLYIIDVETSKYTDTKLERSHKTLYNC